ncbi:MAG: HypC/HybG/HupF family hydrogenase formation chaperone [Propionibacteriaceae bacterium]|nr:HypC/HybG/HupF family hydrogenase formation chaperone [Propionibacteriaceae bacterium]
MAQSAGAFIPGVDALPESCITCSDQGCPAEVVQAPSAPDFFTRVRTAAGEDEIDTTLVGEVAPGDWVLVHAGIAIARLDPQEAE